MATQPQDKSWRKNAAALIINQDGQILLGKNVGKNSYWHFPQGGLRKNESLQHALEREVWEEVGLRPTDYTIMTSISGLKYTYPPGHVKSPKWKGQEQTFFLLVCKHNTPKVNTDRSPEFQQTQWFSLSDIKLSLFPKSKREVAQKVLTFFKQYRNSLTMSLKSPTTNEKKDMHCPQYRVTPGTKLLFSRQSADDRTYFSGSKEAALEEFEYLKNEIQLMQKKLYAQNKHKVLVILQAMDAGGKDGCVKHVFSRVDPQGIRVVPFKKPTPMELSHDFLWRIHQEAPCTGQIAIFNRSHYEDVIAVRVKKLFPPAVWKSRYKHIINFEELLADEGTTIIKFFLNISKDEQKVRLESRLESPDKLWKFHMDDLDDRNRWDEFQLAYQDIIAQTSSEKAPWYIIPANKKWYRNLIVARILLAHLVDLNLSYPSVNFDPKLIKITD